MKLKPIHLLVILIISLTFCCGISSRLIEGMSTQSPSATLSKTSDISGPTPTPAPPPAPAPVPTPLPTPVPTPVPTPSPAPTPPTTNQSSQNNSPAPAPSQTPQIISTMPTYVNVNGITYFRPEYYPLNSYAAGVSKDMIPPGEEEKYLLKTQIVPPVCPATQPIVLYSNNDRDYDRERNNSMTNNYRFYNPYKYYSTMFPGDKSDESASSLSPLLNSQQYQKQTINNQYSMSPVQPNSSLLSTSNQTNINNVNRELSEKKYNYEMYNRLYKPIESSEPIPMLNDFSAF